MGNNKSPPGRSNRTGSAPAHSHSLTPIFTNGNTSKEIRCTMRRGNNRQWQDYADVVTLSVHV